MMPSCGAMTTKTTRATMRKGGTMNEHPPQQWSAHAEDSKQAALRGAQFVRRLRACRGETDASHGSRLADPLPVRQCEGWHRDCLNRADRGMRGFVQVHR